MNDLTRSTLISDLFFNYQNENFASVMDTASPLPVEIDRAVHMDAEIFADAYAELLGWIDKGLFAQWLHHDFMRRL